MDLYEKIAILGPGAQYDTCGPRDLGVTTDIPGVYHAKVGGGAECRLFKVLQTNTCKNNCHYCAFRRDRACSRAVTTSDEMAKAFMTVLGRRLVDGLFLSSGITNTPDYTMSRMLDTVTVLRHTYHYRGYIHLKIMPGSSHSSIEYALNMANRVSINIEAPTQTDLTSLSPDKNFQKEFLPTLTMLIEAIQKRKKQGKRAPSITTQFIVGAGNETDKHLLEATDRLYKKFGLSRVFYSAFRPVDHTPLSEKPPASLVRQHRLYQSDFLLRFYRFQLSDFCLSDQGYLNEDVDPKTLWAKRHPEQFPVNINTASFYNLIRVPGIGPLSAKKIISARKECRITSLDTFTGKRMQTRKFASYMTT